MLWFYVRGVSLYKGVTYMSKYRIVENPSYDLWSSVLNSSSNGNFEQTFEYGEILKIVYPQTRVVRLLAMDNGNPLGIIQGTYSKKLGFGRCVMVGGVHGNAPMTVLKGDEGASVTKDLLIELENYGVRNRIIEACLHWPSVWGMLNVFQDLGYESTAEFNVFTVDLRKSVDELWSSIVSNKRKNVRKAIKGGVEVVEGHSREDLFSFYKMLVCSGERAGFSPSPLKEFEAIWELYRPKELAKIFLAKWSGQDVAGVFIVIHGNTVYALASGSLNEAWSARPNDLLHWKAMEWACERGFSHYNMGLVPQPIPTEGSYMWGLWRWKREWNGTLEKVNVFSKVYLPKVKRLIVPAYEYMKKYRKFSRIFFRNPY